MLRFPEFIKESDWVEGTLVNLADFRRGSFPQPYGLPKWYDEINGLPFIQVYDVGEDFRLKAKTKNKISELAAEQSVFIPQGTVIITIQGSIGRVAITQYDAYIDRTLLLFEKFHFELDKTFFAYALYLVFEIEKKKASGGIIKTITKEVLSKFVLKIPKLKEQQKIASCLSSLDEVITAENKKMDVLKEHKKGLLQNLFPQEGERVPKLRFKEFKGDGEWVDTVLENISSKIMVGIASAATHAYRNKGIILFRNQNIKEGYLDDKDILYIDEEYEKEHKNKRLKAGDLLTARTGYPGTTCVVSEKHEGSQSFTTLITRPKQNIINSIFLSHYINSEKGQAFFNATKIGGGQQNVNAGSLAEMPIIYPSKPEQQKIASCLSSLDELITTQAEKIVQLKQHKKGLLQGLFPTINSEE